MALFRTRIRPPSGIERITRHAFFVGITVFATAHALLAPTLAIAVYFTGFAALAAIGAPLQDRKLLRKWGASYAEYMAITSTIPGAALMSGRQVLAREDRIGRVLALAGVVAAVLLALHPVWSAFNGAPFAGLIAVGGLVASGRRWLYSKRVGNIAS